MMYTQVHRLLEASNEKLDKFNVSAVSDLLTSLALQTRAINATGIAKRYDRTLADAEQVSHFAVVASALLGVAAQSTNTSLPSPSMVVQGLSSGSTASRGAACGT
jgi:hypothetical protein